MLHHSIVFIYYRTKMEDRFSSVLVIQKGFRLLELPIANFRRVKLLRYSRYFHLIRKISKLLLTSQLTDKESHS